MAPAFKSLTPQELNMRQMKLELLLNMLGNETRREILQLLSERPCYISELSQTLRIGQKAIIEHLELMRQAGILDTRVERIEKGRPRKYYTIAEDVIIEVRISPHHFRIERLLPGINRHVLETFPNLASLLLRVEEALEISGSGRVEELIKIHSELMKEHEKLNDARRVIEYLERKVREEIRKEVAAEEFRQLLYP